MIALIICGRGFQPPDTRSTELGRSDILDDLRISQARTWLPFIRIQVYKELGPFLYSLPVFFLSGPLTHQQGLRFHGYPIRKRLDSAGQWSGPKRTWPSVIQDIWISQPSWPCPCQQGWRPHPTSTVGSLWWSISRKKLHLGGDQWNSLSPPGWCLYTVHHRNHPPSWAKDSAKHSNNHPSYVPCRRRKGQIECLLTWDQQSCGFACHYWWSCDSLLHRRVISSAMAVGQKRRLLRRW